MFRVRRTASRFSIVLCTLILVAASGHPVWSGAAPHPVRARNGMVVSSHHLASAIGAEILKKGGNAVDAAIATGFALAVTLPSAGNIGGGGFMVIRTAAGETTGFDFREKAPAAATEKMFLDANGEYTARTNHEGYLAVGVPGTVAGFFAAHERFGSLPMPDLIAPAIRLADKGFPLSWNLASAFHSRAEQFKPYPASARKFTNASGGPYQPGDIWKQPDLARTLKRIRKQGRYGFYGGITAKLIADAMRAHGGLITEQDLAEYEAVERKPVHGTYRGYDIYSMAPPSSGGVAVIEMLNILEGFDLRKAGFGSAQHIHLMAEAMRRAFADRARHLGDPDFNPDMPLDRLLSKEYAAGLRRRISLNRASVSDPVKFNDAYESGETTHFSVIDSKGNAVIVTYTLEHSYGSKIVVDGAGFLLNNEMGDFNPQPGRTDKTGMIGTPPNVVAPGKRMLSSMTPTMVARDGKTVLLIGSPGGKTIINTVLQVILNVIDFDMDVAEAIAAPHIHHQWLPDILFMEKFGVSPDTLALLRMYGHNIQRRGSSRSQGRAMGIQVEARTGIYLGAADPRAPDGGAAGY